MSAWRRNDDVAVVESDDHIVVVNLAGLDQQPVALSGSAWLVYDTVDGTRDTAGVIETLRTRFPDELDLARQVSDCLEALASTGLIMPTPAPPA